MRLGDDWAGCLGQERWCDTKPQRWPSTPDNLIAEEAARDVGYSLGDIRGKRRDQEYAEARRKVALKLLSLGWSYPRVGRAIDRDHGSVWYLINGRKRREAG